VQKHFYTINPGASPPSEVLLTIPLLNVYIGGGRPGVSGFIVLLECGGLNLLLPVSGLKKI
jgi:hypothetical protein